MKRLDVGEVKLFASVLGFTESEAKDITDLFYNLKMENPKSYWRVSTSLNNVNEYIREWENHWHRETNFEECFKYEKDNEFTEYDYEVAVEIFKDIEKFREWVMGDKETQFVYRLPNNNMVVVVC